MQYDYYPEENFAKKLSKIEPWKASLIGGLLSGSAGYFASKGNPLITLGSGAAGATLGYNLPLLLRDFT